MIHWTDQNDKRVLEFLDKFTISGDEITNANPIKTHINHKWNEKDKKNYLLEQVSPFLYRSILIRLDKKEALFYIFYF